MQNASLTNGTTGNTQLKWRNEVDTLVQSGKERVKEVQLVLAVTPLT